MPIYTSPLCSCIICKKVYSQKGIASHYITTHTKEGNDRIKKTTKQSIKKAVSTRKTAQDTALQLTIEKYDNFPNYCQLCNDKLPYSKRKNSFCNRSCAASYTNNELQLSGYKVADEVKHKISQALTKPKITKPCPVCDKLFQKKSKFCSKICRKNSPKIPITQETRNKLIDNAINRHKNKDGIGFQTRSKFESSYPEKITENYFDDLSIKYIREKKISKWFADFTFDNKIVLEIDGQQHLKPERILKDLEKDKDLVELNYIVFRIPYNGKHKEFYRKLDLFVIELYRLLDLNQGPPLYQNGTLPLS